MKFNTDTREIFLYGEVVTAHWGLIGSDTVSDALSERRLACSRPIEHAGRFRRWGHRYLQRVETP